MENKDWREAILKHSHSEYIASTEDLFINTTRVVNIIESVLKSKQEEIEKAIENIEAPTDSVYELESLHEGYFKALDDLKPIISNILKS